MSGWCTGIDGCRNIIRDARSIMQFFSVHQCTEEEQKRLKAFLFAMRHNDIDFEMLEKIVKKYSHLL